MLDERFWSKVDKAHPSGCWVWTANKNNKGYGMFSARTLGFKNKVLAHRLSYMAENGPLKRGQFILHSCDNPSFVNPKHLRAGNAKENVADMDLRNRRVTNPMCGSENPNAILTDDIVVAIRKSYIAGTHIDAICAEFNVKDISIRDITGGRSWRHVFERKDCPSLESIKAEAQRRQKSASKIDRTKAEQIRTRYAHGETGRTLAVEFGIHPATVSDIVHRRIWR